LSVAQRLQQQLLEQSTPTLPQSFTWLKDHALPEPGVEAWKYSPINRLYEALLEPNAANPDALAITSVRGHEATQSAPVSVQFWRREQEAKIVLPEALAQTFSRAIDVERYPLAHALACDLDEVIVIEISGELDDALVIEQASCGNQWVHVRLLANAAATLTECYVSASGGGITTVELAAGARFTHARSYQNPTATSWHLNSANLASNSTYELHQVTLGGKMQRIDNHIRLSEPGAQVSLVGCALCDQNNRSDLQNVVEHIAPNCESNQRYHGVANHSGNLTFGGRIHIHENAPATNAHLTNSNLVLDDRAQINTKPELEIYNDDVSCSHGATIGRLDEDALFYLRSRGIENTRAQTMLLKAFVNDALGGPDATAMHHTIAEILGKWTTAT